MDRLPATAANHFNRQPTRCQDFQLPLRVHGIALHQDITIRRDVIITLTSCGVNPDVDPTKSVRLDNLLDPLNPLVTRQAQPSARRPARTHHGVDADPLILPKAFSNDEGGLLSPVHSLSPHLTTCALFHCGHRNRDCLWLRLSRPGHNSLP